MYIYPAKHFVTPEERTKAAVEGIRQELNERLEVFKTEGKLLEKQRLEARTRFDVEMLLEVGHCPGVENYARWFSGRKTGEPPYTLIDFFPDDFLMVVDESHVTLPQVRGMFAGDHSRKLTLVEHGFRLPSALDNRPLRFDEWEKRVKQVLFMSATPAAYEIERCGGEVVEQVIRPTGLVDPLVHVKAARGQVPDLIGEIKKRVERKERTLVTTLTKRLAEDLSGYFREAGLRCKWLHSELDAIERVQILRELREGGFDVLVGVNLLREGLDLPEVSLVAILDADKEGFLRSETSLIQTIGRAARNVNAEVILYADRVTDSMARAIGETQRRRDRQTALQRGTRHHAGDGQVGDQHGHRVRDRRAQDRGGGGGQGRLCHGGVPGGTARRNAGGGGEPGVRARSRTARPHRQVEGRADDGAAGEEAAWTAEAVKRALRCWPRIETVRSTGGIDMPTSKDDRTERLRQLMASPNDYSETDRADSGVTTLSFRSRQYTNRHVWIDPRP